MKRVENTVSLLVLLLLVAFSHQGIAQQNPHENSGIFLKAKALEDSIELRWAPSDAVAWVKTRETGYYLLRIEHKESGVMDSVWLFSEPFKPKTLEELKATVDQQNKYIALAAQAMYGDDFLMANEAPRNEIEAISMGHDMFQMRYYFALQAADLSKEAADVLTLRWVDKKVTKGATYSYIILNDTIAKTPKIKGGYAYVVNTKPDFSLAPQGLSAFARDQQIELQWLRRQVGDFTMFYVERSDDNGKTYRRIHNDPFFTSFDDSDLELKDENAQKIARIMQNHHVFVDSIPKNYKDYYYRIKGIDAFADVSPASEPIKIHGLDLKAPHPIEIEKLENIIFNHVLIEWKLPKVLEADMAGFRIKRAHDPNGPFYNLHKDLLNKKTTSYLDTTANALHANYYILVIEDTVGNASNSFPRLGLLTDTIPPKAPQALTGIIDTSGLVFLKWPHNEEEDLKGYKVYKSYNLNGAYPQVTAYPVLENGFIDTIAVHSLDRRVYYKIVAVDNSGNHSPYSEPFTLNKPILNPPTTPIIKKIYTENFSIYLEIVGSRSHGVESHQVYRKVADGPWDSIATIAIDRSKLNFPFVDSDVNPKVKYSYCVEAIDSTGIRSDRSFPLQLTIYENRPLPNIENFVAQYDKADKAVKLTWDYATDETLYFVIYKSKDNSRLRAITSVDELTEFTDTDTAKGSYEYAVKAFNRATKQESKMSKTVVVQVSEN